MSQPAAGGQPPDSSSSGGPPPDQGSAPDAAASPSATASSAAPAASSSSRTQLRRRQDTVSQFLRQGERNEVFRNKAPDIMTHEVAPPLGPPPGSAAAASVAADSYSYVALPAAPTTAAPSGSAFGRLLNTLSNRFEKARRSRNSARRREQRRAQRALGNTDMGSSSSSSDEDEEDEARDSVGNTLGGGGGSGSGSGGTQLEREAAAVAARHAAQRRTLDDDSEEQSNFATVDWARQNEGDMLQYHRLHEPLRQSHTAGRRGCCSTFMPSLIWFLRLLWRWVQQGWRASQGWVICGLVGLLTGTLASVIDMCVHFVTDLRMGLCKDNMFLSNKACCAMVGPENDTPDRDNNALQQVCPLWQNWSDIFKEWGVPVLPLGDYVTTYLFYVLFSSFIACLSCWLVLSYARFAAGSGIPEIKTILGGVVVRKVLGGWTLFIKCVGLVLSVSSGLSVGKEGPFVHIAACVGHNLCKLFDRYRHNQAKTNEILSAACAAGVAVAFGAPIGGILYSLEEVSSFFPHKTMWRAFFCAIIASLSVQYFDPFQEGKLCQFQIDYTNAWNWAEMFPFALLGVIGGLFGAFFVAVNLRISRFRKQSFMTRIPMLEVGVVTGLSCAIRFLSSYTRGNSTSLLEALFEDCNSAPGIDPLDMCDTAQIGSTMLSLSFTTIVFLLLTTYSIGMPVPSGLLVPSLTIGAALGRTVGTGVRWMQLEYPHWDIWSGCSATDINCITPGIYALVGGAAVLAGVTRMTIALVVIMMEISSGLTYLLPIMVSVMIAKVVADSFGTDSIYEGAIHRQQYPYLDARHEIPPLHRVSDAMTPGSELICLPIHGHTVATLTHRIAVASELGIAGFPVVTALDAMLVVGYITRSELRGGLRAALRAGSVPGSASGHAHGGGVVTPDTPVYFAMLEHRFPRTGPYVDLSSALDPAPVQVSEYMALYRLADMFSKLGYRYCLVSTFGKVVGIVTKKDIIRYIHAVAHEEEHRKHVKHERRKQREHNKKQMRMLPHNVNKEQ